MTSPFLTPAAWRDIENIYRYIARDSKRHADLVEEAILATCYLAASTPGMGHPRPDLTSRDILFVTVNDYRLYSIAYVRNSNPLRVLKVLHGARHVPRLFRP